MPVAQCGGTCLSSHSERLRQGSAWATEQEAGKSGLHTETLGQPTLPPAKKGGPVGTLPPSRHLFPLCPFPVPTVPCACLLAPASWMPSQRCPARSHAGSQRPCNSAQGKLLHGWLRWRLHHLVKNRATPVPGKTSHTFSTSHNVTALVILT